MTTSGRIALFLRDLECGGAERVMLNLATAFAERTEGVDLVVAASGGHFTTQVPNTVRVVDLRARRLAGAVPRLASYLRRERPVALLSALHHTNIAALAAKGMARTPTRLVISVHNHFSRVIEKAQGALDTYVLPLLVRKWYPLADGIVCVSCGVAKDFSAVTGIPLSRICTIYNPIVTPEIVGLQGESVNHPWFQGDGPPVVLAVGRLTAQKDYPNLIKAFALARSIIDARLLILGEGEQRPMLECMVSDLGLEEHVALPGVVANPHAYMARANVFVLSSAWEGFGNVLVEALAAGATVVATDCESGPAEILGGGRYGRLVKVGDPEALADAIVEALKHPSDASTSRARAADFAVKKIAPQYLEVLLGRTGKQSASEPRMKTEGAGPTRSPRGTAGVAR